MPTIPVDPSFLTSGAEWSVGASPSGAAAPAEGGAGFGDMLRDQLQGLSDVQTQAAEQSMALAAGQATDPTAVVMAVERARLSMQLAGQIRTKAVEAYQDIFHTQV